MDENKVYDWDDEIENDGKGFVTLEEGTYEFEVTSFEKSFYEPSAKSKLPRCNMAVIGMTIRTDEGDAVITDKLQMCAKMEWKLSSFFRCIGLKKHGEKLRMQWDKVIGCKGRAKIVKVAGTKNDGVFFNNIGFYIDPVIDTTPKSEADTWT